MITTRERLVRKTDTAPGGNAVVSTPADSRMPAERGDLHRAEAFGVAGDLRTDLLAVIGEGDELGRQRGARIIEAEVPEGAQRLVGREGRRLPGEPLLGAAPEHRQVQVVHRREVVVDELRLEAGLGGDPPGRDRRIPLGQQQALCRIEQDGTVLRLRAGDTAGIRHLGSIVARAPDGRRGYGTLRR